MIVAVSLGLASCANPLKGRAKADVEQDFKPYVANEMYAIPTAYPVEAWTYPQGTPTREIVNRWRAAGLVDGVRTDAGAVAVVIGPQFYNLSHSGQRGLADAVSQIYNAPAFRLVDVKTKKVVGNYSNHGLHLY